ncbi:MAG: hypothetical protein QOF51_1551 [Chloroflexota bacterium]|jgi:predicted nuclease of predicted toxin-antitoxin system|nr:hypothetical protein [Chloroflexota bacterium]
MRLLLDGHLSPTIAQTLAADGLDAISLRNWLGGIFIDAPDDRILMAALPESRVLVTYDQRTVRPLVEQWADHARHHAGVIVIDEKTIRQDDLGGLIRSLLACAAAAGDQHWGDRLEYLREARRD